jgi:hypothetical protein
VSLLSPTYSSLLTPFDVFTIFSISNSHLSKHYLHKEIRYCFVVSEFPGCSMSFLDFKQTWQFIYLFIFLIHGSVHRDSMLIKRTNSMHQYADIYLPEVADTVFGTPEDGCCDARNM